MEGIRQGDVPSMETRWSTSKKTHLALAALMALTPAVSASGRAEFSPSHHMEAKGNKIETFKNVTVQALGLSYIDWQKRYQEIAIIDWIDTNKHGSTLTVRVVNEVSTGNEHIGQLTKGTDGEYWFTSQKIVKPIYQDVPSDGNGEQ